MVKVIVIGQPEAMSGPAGIPLPAPRPGRGSGVVVTSDCLVVTNRHVVEHAAALAVRFWRPDRLYAARVAHLSSTHDLAVLVVDRDVCAPIVSPVAAVTPVRGMTVFKIGFGGDATREAMTNKVPAIQRGVLSRPVDVAGAPTLEVYVPVEAGDSGGLVCAEDGAMVGLTLAHGRARAEIGYVVPGALVAATLYQAQSTGAIARARAELADPAFPAERLAAELGAAIAEGEPAAAVLRQAAAVRELEQSLALRWRGRPAGRLVLAALAASAGALRALEPSPPERAAGCRLLARAREAMAEERWRTPGAAPTVYETQLAAALAHGLPLAAACGPAPRARPAPGAATAPAPPASAPAVAAGPVVWRSVLGQRTELYARWAAAFRLVDADWSARPEGVQLGGTLPFAAYGDLAIGLALGYAYTNAEARNVAVVHRFEVPLRLDYGAVFLDAGLVVAMTTAPSAAGLTAAQAEALNPWGSGPGLVLRLGVRRVVQAGLDLVACTNGTRGLVLWEFFAGIGWQ